MCAKRLIAQQLGCDLAEGFRNDEEAMVPLGRNGQPNLPVFV